MSLPSIAGFATLDTHAPKPRKQRKRRRRARGEGTLQRSPFVARAVPAGAIITGTVVSGSRAETKFSSFSHNFSMVAAESLPIIATMPSTQSPLASSRQNMLLQLLTGAAMPTQDPDLRAFLHRHGLSQYYQLLASHGCETLDDLAGMPPPMLIGLGLKIFHATRLHLALLRHRASGIGRGAQTTGRLRRKRARHAKNYCEVYSRMIAFQRILDQVGSLAAAERDPRTLISRGTFVHYRKMCDLAKSNGIDLTNPKYSQLKPTEKNVLGIIQRSQAGVLLLSNRHGGRESATQSAISPVGVLPSLGSRVSD